MTTSSERHTDRPFSKQSGVQRGDFWVSVLVLVFVVEFFITVAALCWGIITTPPRQAGGSIRLDFPWIGWIAAVLLAPAAIVGLAHAMAGRDMAESTGSDAHEEAWLSRLPDRALKLYKIARNAPLFVVCIALVALGSTLLAIDSAFVLLTDIALALVPYAPYFIGGVTLFAIAIAALMAWFRYSHNKLAADYAFRREVLERTGIILVDSKGKALLPPDGRADGSAIGLIGGENAELTKALPVGEEAAIAPAEDTEEAQWTEAEPNAPQVSREVHKEDI